MRKQVAGQLTNLKSKKKTGTSKEMWALLGHFWGKAQYRATTQVDKKTFYSKGKKRKN